MLNENDLTFDTIVELIRKNYSYFSKLSSEFRNNPYLLHLALQSFDGGKREINPINYALKEALTEENISLALEKGGNINIYGLLRENELFHKLNIEKCAIPIAYSLLPTSIKENDDLICLYMRKCPDEYKNLNVRQRNDPKILKEALLHYDSKLCKVNPISYALEGALTEENMSLALEKGNMIFVKGSPLLNIKYFILKFFKDGHNIYQYVFLSDALKSDPEVLEQALSHYDNKICKVNPISYALEGALTKENIDLAFEKGDIKKVKGASVLNNKYFVMEAFKRKLFAFQYDDISDALKSDPEVLKQALLHYDGEICKVNPISYALEGALTSENMSLALEKGDIILEKDSSISNNKLFILLCLRNRVSLAYENVSDALKEDTEIQEVADKSGLLGPVKVPVEASDHWAPAGSKQLYKYFQAAICVMPNGTMDEEEVRGNGELYKDHHESLNKIVGRLSEAFPLDNAITTLKDKFADNFKNKGDCNPYNKAVVCSQYGLLVLLIEGENCQIFFPDVITSEQFNYLVDMLNHDLRNLFFEYLYRGKVCLEIKKDVFEKGRSLVKDDVTSFLNNEIEIRDISVSVGRRK